MPSLQVRNLPEALYQKLVQASEREHRSIAQQAVVLLAEALNVSLSPQNRRKLIVQSINDFSDDITQFNLSDPAKIIREDRNR